MLPMRLVTHKNCMDGSACAIIFKMAFPHAEVLFVNPHEVDAIPGRDDTWTWFADVCPTEIRSNEVVCDHHKTNIERIQNPPSRCVLNDSHCGCWLLLEKLISVIPDVTELQTLRNFVGVVDDFDRWILERPVSRTLAQLHEFYGQQVFIKEFSKRLADPKGICHINDWALVTDNERKIVKALDEQRDLYITDALTRSWELDVGDERGVAVFAEQHRNDLAHVLLDAYPDASYAIVIDLSRNTCSMRSRDPVHDCSAIAKHFGGGGHPCAAGFPIQGGTIEELRVVFGG